MADVTSTFSSLSSTESNNAPSGSTTIAGGLDDNLRMIEAHVAAWRDQTGWAGLNLSSVSGTNTITATLATAGSVTFGPTALSAGMRFVFIPANTNTGATTLDITSPNGGSSLGAKNIYWRGNALVGGELLQNVPAEVQYDGTQFNLKTSAALASAATTLTGTDTSQPLTAGGFAGNKSLGTNSGYYKFPGGFIIQWVNNVTCNTAATTDVTWPTAFPTACVGATVLANTITNGPNGLAVTTLNTTKASVANTTGTNITPYVIGIGY